MRRIYDYFKHLRLSHVFLTAIATSLLFLSTACSPSPSSSLDTPRTVDQSASPSRDASDVAKRQLIDKAKRQQAPNPIDAVGEQAEDVSKGVNRAARDLSKQTQRALEDTSDAIEDQASDTLKDAQRAVNKAADAA